MPVNKRAVFGLEMFYLWLFKTQRGWIVLILCREDFNFPYTRIILLKQVAHLSALTFVTTVQKVDRQYVQSAVHQRVQMWRNYSESLRIFEFPTWDGGAVGWDTVLQVRKVAGSIPDGFVRIFHWHNPSSRTMALGSTQPLTEMSTRNIIDMIWYIC
jgi:hypothetical protein